MNAVGGVGVAKAWGQSQAARRRASGNCAAGALGCTAACTLVQSSARACSDPNKSISCANVPEEEAIPDEIGWTRVGAGPGTLLRTPPPRCPNPGRGPPVATTARRTLALELGEHVQAALDLPRWRARSGELVRPCGRPAGRRAGERRGGWRRTICSWTLPRWRRAERQSMADIMRSDSSCCTCGGGHERDALRCHRGGGSTPGCERAVWSLCTCRNERRIW